MILYPAIDLKNGNCVRLSEGDFNKETTYDVSPVDQAAEFEDSGAQWLHIVDLDGAKDSANKQTNLISKIVKETSLNVQTGGGIRTTDDLKSVFDAGAKRAVIGSLAITNPSLVKQWILDFGGDKITLALDVKPSFGVYHVQKNGWQDKTNKRLWDVASEFNACGIKHILCTDISKDGLLQGPNNDLYIDAQRRHPDIDWIASGGVSSIKDLQTLKKTSTSGVVIGKALYEGRFTFKTAKNSL
ncbi:MAG: 1-(5-phosphoribosyl)-5-[(5-phosphoribosylamino)methylideneamino]imidazole-4-carboxamide isomerase [Alphaproteobacteria bacterium]|nr:MAG: 1-(5-phosphoribosyl)-5-[(5-phosphoribosylamino)methylideneamino]imidazole-4-carboxamide isomerase [Alphaproteobacteria bacterium]